MSNRCYTIDVDGEPAVARFTREPSEAEVAAFRELVRTIRGAVTLTPEQAERQAAARERSREWLARIRGAS